ncbi:hypothetical protein [Gloeocapsopsis crepidinum]|nr:hypothetical protein [Gloeocapsopsis crepidinum]
MITNFTIAMVNTESNSLVPQGRTAIIVIHGIGDQNLLDTLDNFTRGLVDYFGDKLSFDLSHRLAKRKQANDSIWTESFVRLTSENSQADWLIDVHEYYWAYQTEEKVQICEVLQWMQKTLHGTFKFYDQHLDMKVNRRFPLRKLAWLIYFFSLLYPVLRVGAWLGLSTLNLLPVGSFFKSAWSYSKKLVIPSIVGYVGDIAIYTTTDRKSPYFNIRRKILAESQTFLEEILHDKEAKYDQVIIAGHSLGSAIAYDTLNELCIKTSLDLNENKVTPEELHLNKIQGLVTFGSPLDKIAFFLREKVAKTQYVRQRIIEQLTSFRMQSSVITDQTKLKSFFRKNPVCYQMQHLKWFNYYHRKDPISGNLDCYEDVNNQQLNFTAAWGAKAHGGYWKDPNFFDSVAKNFLYEKPQKINSVKQEINV